MYHSLIYFSHVLSIQSAVAHDMTAGIIFAGHVMGGAGGSICHVDLPISRAGLDVDVRNYLHPYVPMVLAVSVSYSCARYWSFCGTCSCRLFVSLARLPFIL